MWSCFQLPHFIFNDHFPNTAVSVIYLTAILVSFGFILKLPSKLFPNGLTSQLYLSLSIFSPLGSIPFSSPSKHRNSFPVFRKSFQFDLVSRQRVSCSFTHNSSKLPNRFQSPNSQSPSPFSKLTWTPYLFLKKVKEKSCPTCLLFAVKKKKKNTSAFTFPFSFVPFCFLLISNPLKLSWKLCFSRFRPPTPHLILVYLALSSNFLNFIPSFRF